MYYSIIILYLSSHYSVDVFIHSCLEINPKCLWSLDLEWYIWRLASMASLHIIFVSLSYCCKFNYELCDLSNFIMKYFSQTCQGKVYYVCNYSKVSHKKSTYKVQYFVECNIQIIVIKWKPIKWKPFLMETFLIYQMAYYIKQGGFGNFF